MRQKLVRRSYLFALVAMPLAWQTYGAAPPQAGKPVGVKQKVAQNIFEV
ncbi:MAG: hypothetical protein KJ964_10460 [Verrucomicrobia bacterium]|nr:hypothetical protein [Verrucomicrobiota bacterium]MBU1735251.1 hypothetical protein [Verrucomicrobiota bacterium]MBU1857611.1 hypothetical protein [Verrucomicrobiota bacterium]